MRRCRSVWTRSCWCECETEWGLSAVCCLPLQSNIRSQIYPPHISQSFLQATILQEGLRFYAAVKNFSCSQVVEPEEETTMECLEDVQKGREEEPPKPATPWQLKKCGKKRWRWMSLIQIFFFSLFQQVDVVKTLRELITVVQNCSQFCADLITCEPAPPDGHPVQSQPLFCHACFLTCVVLLSIKYTVF